MTPTTPSIQTNRPSEAIFTEIRLFMAQIFNDLTPGQKRYHGPTMELVLGDLDEIQERVQ